MGLYKTITDTLIMAKMVLLIKSTIKNVTFAEFLLPLYPIFLAYALSKAFPSAIQANDFDSISYFEPQSLYAASGPGLGIMTGDPSRIAFSPDKLSVRTAASRVCNYLNISVDDVTFYNTTTDMTNLGWENNHTHGLAYHLNENDELTGDFTVFHSNLQIQIDFLNYTEFGLPGYDIPQKNYAEDIFLTWGYSLLQTLGMISVSDNFADPNFGIMANLPLTLTIQKSPKIEDRSIINYMDIAIAIQMIFTFSIVMFVMLALIGTLHDEGIYMQLKLKSMSQISYYYGCYLGSIIIPILSCFVICLILYLLDMIKYTNYGIVLTWFIGFVCAQQAFLLLVPIIIDDKVEKLQVAVTQIANYLNMLPLAIFYLLYYLVLPNNIDNSLEPVIYLLYLFYPVPFVHLILRTLFTELDQRSMNFPHDEFFEYSGVAYAFIFIDIILYIIIGIIIISIREYLNKKNIDNNNNNNNNNNEDDKEYAIVIDNLYKKFRVNDEENKNIFGKPKKKDLIAINNVSFKLKKNNVLAIIGQNGSGKSTLMNLISGKFKPTKGTGYVNGYNIITQQEQIRQSLGYAPQFDIFLNGTTCYNQLYNFARIAGYSKQDANEEALTLLEDLNLLEKKDEKIDTLSGGQKRRISLATAVIGKPKILLLDEISSGIDVALRKRIWKLLQRLKKHSTIIIVTHSFAEAEQLADVVLVLKEGEKQACAPIIDLKSQYGSGYNLFLNYKKDTNENDLLNYCNKFVNGCEIKNNNGTSELVINLPIEEKNNYVKLFNEIDNNLDKININSFNISPPTLEDVFLHFFDEEKNENDNNNNNNNNNNKNKNKNKNDISIKVSDDNNVLIKDIDDDEDESDEIVEERFDTNSNFNTQVSGYVKMNFKINQRDPLTCFCLLVIPWILTILVSVLFAFVINSGEPPKKKLVYPQHDKLYNQSSYPYYINNVDDLNDNEIQFAKDLLNSNDDISKNFTSFNEIYDILFINENYKHTYPYIVNFESLNLTSYDVDMNIVYNQTIFNSLRTALGTIQDNLFPDHNNQIFYQEFKQTETNAFAFDTGFTLFVLAFAYLFNSQAYASQICDTKEGNIKNLLLLSGLSRFTYWFSHYLTHFIISFSSICVTVIILASFNVAAITSTNGLGIFLLIFLFVHHNIFIGYCLSLLFKSSKEVNELGTQFVLISYMISFFVMSFGLNPNDDITIIITNIFGTFIPGSAFYRGLALLQTASSNNEPLLSLEDIFNWDNEFVQVLVNLLCGAIFYILLLIFVDYRLYDYNKWGCLNKNKSKSNELSLVSKQELFENENKLLPKPINYKITDDDIKNNPIAADEVRKTYYLSNGKEFHAVKDVSLTVKKGTILGFLGPNGAGKSSFLNTITGVETITNGDCFINSISIKSNLEESRKHLGFCFQFDAFSTYLKPKELLAFLAEIRGVPKNKIKKFVDFYIKQVDLTLKQNDLAKTLSGGNKRKTSVALSMITAPKVLLLDEPTTGIDSIVTRSLWKFIQKFSKERAIILTTHSMEEAESLSNEISIIVSGAIRLQGTTQELKDKHGKFISITLRLNETKDIKESINKSKQLFNKFNPNFPNDDELNLNSFIYKFNVSSTNNIADIFNVCNNDNDYIIDYSVSQTTLEDVFIELAEKSSSS